MLANDKDLAEKRNVHIKGDIGSDIGNKTRNTKVLSGRDVNVIHLVIDTPEDKSYAILAADVVIYAENLVDGCEENPVDAITILAG